MTFHRGRLRRAALWIVIAGGWVTVVALGLWFLGLAIEPGWSVGKALQAAMVAGSGLRLGATMAALRRWNRRFAGNRLTIDDLGVRGRLNAGKLDLAWAEVKGIASCKLRGAYVLETSHGAIPFSALDIPRPKRAARAIAERLGHAL